MIADSRLALPRGWLPNVALPIEAVWRVAAIVAPFIAGAGISSFSGDTWWALSMGRLSVDAGRPVGEIVLAHTPTVAEPTNGQWLGQVVLYACYAAGGELGVRLLGGLVATVTFGLLLATARVLGGTTRVSTAAVMLGVLLAASNVGPRAQLLALPLFAATTLLLHLRHRRPLALLALPPIFLIWTNVHGSFALGLLLLGLFLVGDAAEELVLRRGRPFDAVRVTRDLVLATVASLAATLINPLGIGVYGYVASLTSNPVMSMISEWRPLTVREPLGLLFSVAVVIVGGVLRASPRRLSVAEIFVLLACGHLALSSERNVIWAAMTLVPILAGLAADIALPAWATRALADGGARRSMMNTALVGLLVAFAACTPLWLALVTDHLRGGAADAEVAPIAATEYVARLPEGTRLFHYQPWTGYLDWRLWPVQLPFLDGRIEVHPVSVWSDYLAVTTARADWETILDRYEVDYLMLQRADQGRLARFAEETGRWTITYEDEVAVVLARSARRG